MFNRKEVFHMNPFFNMKDLQGFMEQLTESNFRGMPLNGFNIQKTSHGYSL